MKNTKATKKTAKTKKPNKFFASIANFFKTLELRNVLMLTLAGVINAIGVTIFLAPLSLIDSGFSGTSFLLDSVTPSYLSLSLFLIVLNFPFYIFANKKIGTKFLVYSLYAISIYSLVAFLIQNVFPIDFSEGSPIVKDDKLLGAIFGGLISGLGSGLVIRYGGAIDGVEVMAVMFAKKIGLSVGTFIMAYNVVLYVVSAIVTTSWLTPLYSLIAYYVGLKVVDMVVDGLDKGKGLFIITDFPDQIAQQISCQLSRSVTILDGHGYYSNQSKKIVYVVINRFELPKLRKIVQKTDSKAFVSIHDVSEVIGTKIKFNVNYSTDCPTDCPLD